MADEEQQNETERETSSAPQPEEAPAAAPAPRRRTRATAASKDAPEQTPSGPKLIKLDLPEAVFGHTPNMSVMHQAFVRQSANARQGTAATKTRALVSGGGAKPYRQKGTGRARHGSNREPSMMGGGTVFGPQPRSYAQRMPRKMRRLALRSALSVKASEGKVSVVEGFILAEPKTRVMVEQLRGLGVEDTVLVVLPASNDVVARSVNNLPWAKVVLAQNLNLYDIFTHDQLVITRDALGLIEEQLTS